MIERRQFLRLGLAALCAPAIVRATSLMPVKALPGFEGVIHFPGQRIYVCADGNATRLPVRDGSSWDKAFASLEEALSRNPAGAEIFIRNSHVHLDGPLPFQNLYRFDNCKITADDIRNVFPDARRQVWMPTESYTIGDVVRRERE